MVKSKCRATGYKMILIELNPVGYSLEFAGINLRQKTGIQHLIKDIECLCWIESESVRIAFTTSGFFLN